MGYSKQIIKVDENRLMIKFNGKAVARTTIQADKLIVEWLDPKWEEWKDLQDSSELKSLLETADRRLKQASETIAKGKGKGLGASVSALQSLPDDHQILESPGGVKTRNFIKAGPRGVNTWSLGRIEEGRANGNCVSGGGGRGKNREAHGYLSSGSVEDAEF